MRRASSWITWITVGLFTTACGARTGDDELLGYDSGSGGALTAAGGGAGESATGGSWGGEPDPDSCCVMGETCRDPAITSCVCDGDEYCCSQGWDAICVQLAQGCGAPCGPGGIGGAPSTGGVGSGGTSTGGVSTGGVSSGGTSTGGRSSGGTSSGGTSTGGGTSGGGSGGTSTGGRSSGGTSGGGSGGTSTGGSNTGGGGGDVAECRLVFPDSCGSCMCESCSSEMSACLGNFGCLAIASCIASAPCNTLGCYYQSCRGVIDAVGGFNSPAFQRAVNFVGCQLRSGCPC